MAALDALNDEPRWVAWRNEQRGERITKVPHAPNGGMAKANDPTTWGTRDGAERRLKSILNGLGGGIGIELGDLDGDTHLAGLDLDSCRGEDGALAPWAKSFLDHFPTYTEISPSARGLKLFFYCASENVRPFLDQIGVLSDQWGCRRSVPGADARDHGPAIEVYFALRYFAVTNERWRHSPDRIMPFDRDTLDRLTKLIPPARNSASTSAPSTGRAAAAGGGDTSRSAIAFRRRSVAGTRLQEPRRDDRGAEPRPGHRRLGAPERAIVE